MDASEGENIGYVIPLPVIYHFLKDYDMNKRSTGFPRLGKWNINIQKMTILISMNSVWGNKSLKGIYSMLCFLLYYALFKYLSIS